jgi:parallel beta-helix repeat protein
MIAAIRFGESVFPHLLDVVWKGTALMAMVFALSRVLGKRRVAARYWLWVYCLIGVLILPATPVLATEAPKPAEEEPRPGAAGKFGERAIVAADGSGDTRSIQEAVEGVDAHGTISIKPGTYREQIVISKPVRIEGAGREKTRIEATSRREGERWVAVSIQSCRDVGLEGLTITSGTRLDEQSGLVLVDVQDAGVRVEECNLLWGQYGIGVSGKSDARIERCLVAGIWGTGIAIGRDASATVTNCEVRNCYHRCITLRSKGDVRIANNLISGSAWHGIRYDHCSPVIEGNVIRNNARSGIYASGSGEAKIANNLFLRNEMCGISTWYRTNPLIKNNVFAKNERSGLEMDVTTRLVIENNIFYANETAATRFYTSDSRQLADSSPPPELSYNLLWKNTNETPPPPRPREEILAEHKARIAQLELELAQLKEKLTDGHPQVAAKRQEIEMGKELLAAIEKAAAYKPPELSFSETALRADPLFEDAEADNYGLRRDSPCRGAGKDGADIGATLSVSVTPQYPITPEEKLIIPDAESRDYTLWKKGPAGPPLKAAERKPSPAAGERATAEVIIDVTKEGKFVVGQVERSIEELAEMLRQVAKENPKANVVVRGDREAAWGDIMEVLDACKKADLGNVSFAVRETEAKEEKREQPSPPGKVRETGETGPEAGENGPHEEALTELYRELGKNYPCLKPETIS